MKKPCLPNNRSIAESRLGQLKRKLSRAATMQIKYTDFFDDPLIKGDARNISEQSVNDISNISWYLSHHNVVIPKAPQKVRVVFDCFTKFTCESLNNNVLQGTDLTISLINNIWFPDSDLLKKPKECQMLVHLFGEIWFSCCANYALQRTALDNAETFDADVISTVQKDFYLDDLISSEKTSEDAIRMQQQLTRMLAYGGFYLTNWNGNCRTVLDGFPLVNIQRN